MRPIRFFRRFGSLPAMSLCGVLLSATGALGQIREFAPVAIDDSPVADRLLAEVEAQYSDNPERAVELLAELLDGYADRVVSMPDEPEGFRSVRSAVLSLLVRELAVQSAWRREFDVEADALLERSGAAETWRRRPFTPAGREAGLRLAQRAAETGSPETAIRLLEAIDAWPEDRFENDRRRRDLLAAEAWIAIARSDAAPASRKRRDDAIEKVRSHSPELAARLASWAAVEPSGDAASIPMSVVESGRQDWTVLWEAPLEETLFLRRTTDRATGRNLHSDMERLRREARYLTSVPAVFDDLVIVNEGHLLEGIDRFTGRLRWFRDFGTGSMLGGSGLPGDLNEIVIDDGDAYTVLGHSFSGGRGDQRAIVRFDAATGMERWSVDPDRISEHPILEDSEPSGPPLLLGDLVVVPLRKTTSRLETIDLVLALDRRDGAVRWIRTIASSASLRAVEPRPYGRLAAIDGDVLIASAAGAIARLDGPTGSVVWLRREDVPLRGVNRFTEAWQVPSPVVLDRGIASLDASRTHWQLLDPETGSLLERHPIGTGTIAGDVGWLGVVRGVLDGRDLLLAIGTDVIAIDPESPDTALWSWRSMATAAGALKEGDGAGAVRGRVTIASDGVLVPVVDGVMSVDAATGRVRRLFDFDGPVNPVLAADAIHVVGSESVATVMPVMDAVATLERRIRESEDAVPQAIALLDLAMRIGRPDLQRLAASAAVDGLRTPGGEEWRSEVLDLLLAAVPSASDEDGLALLDLAAEAAGGDLAGIVRHRLARAAWMQARGRGDEAVEEWLGIMGDAQASSLLVSEGGGFDIAVGTIARARLRDARNTDPELDRRLDLKASREVADAIESRVTASVLVDLARRWTGTDAAETAAARAIEILRDEGDALSVMSVGLMVARGFELDDPRRASVLADAAAACAESGRPVLARALRSATGGVASTTPRPRIAGVPDHLEAIPGRLVSVAPDVVGSAPSDLVLLFDAGTAELVARDAEGLVERWRRPWTIDHLLVEWSPDLLIWENAGQRQPILSSLDPATGEVRWSTPDVSRLLPAPDRHAINADGFLPDGRMFQPWEILSRPIDAGVLLVRRDGAASLVDRVDGRTVIWSRRGLLDRVHGVSSGGGLVHIHGSGVDDRGEVVGRLVSLDPASGRIVLDETIDSGEIRWAVPDPLGRVAVGTSTEVHVLDPIGSMLGGGDRWRRRRTGAEEARLGWISNGDLVLLDDTSAIVVWDLATGRVEADRWAIPEDRQELLGRPLATLDLGDRRVLHLDARLVMHDPDGDLLGMDAMAIPGRRDQRVLPVQDGLLLVTRITAGAPGGAVHRIQRLDSEAGLKLVGQPFEIAGGRPYTDVRVVDGWLLLSTEVETHAVPMSASPESNSDLSGRP